MFKDTTPNRNCFCCLLVLGAFLVLPICTFFASVSGLGDDLMRWQKSLEFPAIEARSKPYSDLLTTATQDVLIKEDQSIDHVKVSITHSEWYTGIVGVTIKRIYASNRPFESVQAEMARFFSTKSNWKAETFAGEDTSYLTVTEFGVACVWLSKAKEEEYPDSGAKYKVVYEIELDYLEPVKSCRLE